jgi:hypothetical protein
LTAIHCEAPKIMTDINADAARARAQAMRQARLGRVRLIRRRIVAGSVALFVAAWLLITILMVTGHDPALSKSTAASVASSSGSTGSSGSGSTSSASSSTGSGSGSTSSVTTQQS